MPRLRNTLPLLAIALALLVPASGSADGRSVPGVIVLDSSSKPFLRSQASTTSRPDLLPDTLPALLLTALGAAPSATVSSTVAAQVDELLLPGVFHKPAVVFSLNVAGVNIGDWEAFLQPDIPSYARKLATQQPFDILRKLDTVFLSIKESVTHMSIDSAIVRQDCDTVCVEESSRQMASYAKGWYADQDNFMNSTLHLKIADRPETVLKMSRNADRMLLLEMVTLYQLVSRGIAMHTSQLMKPLYFDATITGIQRMQDTYGKHSAEYQAAVMLVASSVNMMMQQLSGSHNDLVVTQINILGHVNVEDCVSEDTALVAQWQRDVQPFRARYLAEVNPSFDQGDNGTKWSKGALLWVTFWILLWFSWLCIYSLCTMPFKQDTLLYAKGKAE